MKTSKTAKKRIHVTKGGKGKLMRRKKVDGKLTKARSSSKRSTRKNAEVNRSDKRSLKRMIPGI